MITLMLPTSHTINCSPKELSFIKKALEIAVSVKDATTDEEWYHMTAMLEVISEVT